jgi:hypothetical protein
MHVNLYKLTKWHITSNSLKRKNIVGCCNMEMKTVKGSCHCQAVKFEIDTNFEELTTCDCSICLRKNALMVKVHDSAMRLLSGKDALSTYTFHTHTAQHYFCSICGIYPFHRKRVTPDYFGVNVYCLDQFDPAGIPVRATIGKGMT